MSRSVVIIGGGIGGLFTGTFLSKNGYSVTILEKNLFVGGGLQSFSRKGKVFDTGMHVMGGFEEGGVLTKICRYLGIYDHLSIHQIPAGCIDEIYVHSTGDTYRIASGKEDFIKSVAAYFPREEGGIREYVDALFALTKEHPLYNLNETVNPFRSHSDMYSRAADDLIARYVKDERLRELLAYLNPLYGGEKGRTPAYVHALISALFINGASRFVGGSQQLADKLRHAIEANGGRVLTGKEVVDVEVAGDEVKSVATADGARYTADYFISTVHIDALLNLIPGKVFRKRHAELIHRADNTYSAFSLYIDLKPDMFPYIDHTCYYMEDYGLMWNQEEVNSGANPRAFMYMTPPEPNQGKFASRMLVHCVLSYDEVRKWENTRIGRRGDDYRQWKHLMASRLISKLENLFPRLSDYIAGIYTASPLTIRDYLNAKDGAMFGYRKDCLNMTIAHLPVQTKLRNLLLSGQNVNMHGMYGVPLTAIQTAEALLGRNNLVKAINDANKSD